MHAADRTGREGDLRLDTSMDGPEGPALARNASKCCTIHRVYLVVMRSALEAHLHVYFHRTLQKILSFVRANTGGKLMRRILRHAEDALLLKQCQDGLTHALNVFSVRTSLFTAHPLI